MTENEQEQQLLGRRNAVDAWHKRTITEGQLAEEVYRKPLEEILRMVPASHRAVAMRAAFGTEQWITVHGSLQRGNSCFPRLIVEPIPQPQFPVRFEYVGPFEGGCLVPEGHVAIDARRSSAFGGECFACRGEYDLYRVVRAR